MDAVIRPWSRRGRRRRHASRCIAAAVGLCICLVAGLAAGDPPLAGDRAVELANQGLADYGAGKWEEAYESFRLADGIVPSPPFQLYMARARRQQQRLLEAREIYKKIASGSLAADAPVSSQQAQTDARAELGEVEAAIGSIVVTVEGAKGPVSLTLDGKPIAAGSTIEVDPGKRELVATSDGKVATKTLELRAGQRGLSVVIDVGAKGEGGAKDQGEVRGGPHLATWGWVLGGLGAASSIAGAVLGGVALERDASISERCTPICPSSERESLESDQRTMLALADASTGTLIAGGVLLATGVTLLVIDTVAKPGAPRVEARVGSSGLGFRVSF